MEESRSAARTAGLVAIAFLGTLIVLVGLALGYRSVVASPTGSPAPTSVAVASPSPAAETPAASTPPAASATSVASGSPAASSAPTSPVPTPSGDPSLVGAGDIASCGLDGDEQTAKLIDGIAGTVFTAGDNAYEVGSTEEFKNCYDPTWGRFKDRTRPSAGNHDWLTQDARGYR